MAHPKKNKDILLTYPINDWDIEACGGTHLDNTGDIGIIKLTGSERIQDGVVRIEILAGEPALKYIQFQEAILKESSSELSVEPKILPKTVKRFFKEWKEQKKLIENLNKQIAELQFSSTKITSEKIKDEEVIIRKTTGNQKELIIQASEAIKSFDKGLCILLSEVQSKIVIVGVKTPSSSADISGIVKELSLIAGGSGGGKGDLAIGGGPNTEKIDEILNKTKEIIKSKI